MTGQDRGASLSAAERPRRPLLAHDDDSSALSLYEFPPMIDERAPCSICQSTFRGLCAALDAVRTEAAELRAEHYGRLDGPERAPSPTSSTVRELRLELADAQQQIGELEKANRHWRDVAAAERSRAAAAEDALRRSYRVALAIGMPAARHA